MFVCVRTYHAQPGLVWEHGIMAASPLLIYQICPFPNSNSYIDYKKGKKLVFCLKEKV